MSGVVIAHAGSWLTDLAFMMPAVGFIAWLGFTKFRDRRLAAREGEQEHTGRDERRDREHER
jgi:hypothetical protein